MYRRQLLVSSAALGYGILLYGLCFGTLWGLQGISLATLWLVVCCCFMVVLHMLFIDMQDIPEKYMYRVFVAVFFLTTFIAIGHAAPLFFLIVSLLFHVGIVRIYTCVRKNHRIYRRVSPWRMITGGLRDALVYMVLVVCGILAHSWQQAEISCVFIERNRERVIQFVPMTFLPIEENESPTFDDMFSLDTDVLDDMLTTLAGLDMGEEGDTPFLAGVQDAVGRGKEAVVGFLAQDRQIIQKGFCDILIEQIHEKKKTDRFLLSTSLLLFLLVLPLAKVIAMLISVVGRGLLMILIRAGVFTREYTEETVETLH